MVSSPRKVCSVCGVWSMF